MKTALEIFDFSQIRGELKRLFTKAGVTIPMIYTYLTTEQKKEMPIEKVLNWFHRTSESGDVTNMVPKSHVEAFANAAMRAIAELGGDLTEADVEKYIVKQRLPALPRRLSSRNPS